MAEVLSPRIVPLLAVTDALVVALRPKPLAELLLPEMIEFKSVTPMVTTPPETPYAMAELLSAWIIPLLELTVAETVPLTP
jgi:hypothetical protein